MKNLICYVLIVWLALLSGGANAHSASDAAHEAVHVAHSQTSNNQAPANADGDPLQSDHATTCHQGHCGHGHCTGLLTSLPGCLQVATSTTAAVSRCCWASAGVVDDIERPKWPATAPAVVSLLN